MYFQKGIFFFLKTDLEDVYRATIINNIDNLIYLTFILRN